MKADVYWVLPGRLALLSQPGPGDALEADIRRAAESGVQTVVTLLTPEEEVELGLGDEIILAGKHGMEFLRYPVPGNGVPRSSELFAATLRDLAESGRAVGVHCREGSGRSFLAAAGIMLCLGRGVEESLEKCGVSSELGRWLQDHVRLFGG